ncbi:metabotropic glutamate receptor [Nephila pilipes]|uniref:Metabotropic glutamate receptor n=1 Tax=Nephila pilipes TaxID=299642 RepID=A0A8X6NE82_NEPPI|nr:metabotropic glutamate receptor [Nephila pilipes]
MELNREHFRAIIFHNFRRGLSRQECFDELNSLYSDKAPSYSTVKNWYNEFNRGRCSIQDESRVGRPKSVVVPEKINAVRELIKQDRHVTYREIEASLDISMTSINKILHEHLSVKKICSRWIPHNLTNAQKTARVDWCKEMLEKYIQGTSKAVYNIYTGDESWIYAYEPETKQQSTVWVFQDEAKPTKVVRGRSTSKQMIACFFGINGHVATVALEQRRTVNSEWYTTICLPEAFTVLEQLLSKSEICIAVKERLTKDSGVAGDSYYDSIVQKLMAKPSARGVIIFGSDQEVAGVMRAVRRNNCTGHFTWIGSDGWSARSLVFAGHEDQVEGTVSVQPRAHPVQGFDAYFQSLGVHNNTRNPWFTEFWEHFFNCRWPGSTVTPYNQHTKTFCNGEEMIGPAYEVEKQLQFVSDSVLAFAYALKNLHEEQCGGRPGICAKMDPIDGAMLLGYLKNVTFRGLSGDEFQFSENGDGPARYNIIHFKQISPGNYKWIRVGEYRDGELQLSLSDIRFRWEEPDMPISACSLPCSIGQAKKYVEGSKCCWHCFNCTKYQILRYETTCYDCPLGFLPNAEHTQCERIPLQYMRLDSYWAIGVMIFSSLGIVITLFVIIVFIKHHDTPVVKASGRELSYVLLGGIFLCYAITFLLVQKPSDIKCGAQKMGIGLCFTIVYSAVLTKTNRIDRIFRCGARSTKRPSFISPKSQLFICGVIVSIQVIFSAMWMGFSPPKAILYHPSPDESHLVCAASIDATYMVAFAYPMVLILICTVYAILTRKIPEAFNESKYIGFTMYTTCIVWLAFIPLYFTTTDHDEINVFTMSVTVSLSATVTLFCLFTPKLYIILLHPDKNVRQPLMNHSKYTGSNDIRVTPNKAERTTISEGSLETNEVTCRSSASPNPPRLLVTCGTQTTSDIIPAGIARCVSCTVISTLRNDEDNMRL